MPKQPVTSGKKLVALLEQNGFFIARTSGSHYILKNASGRRITVPHGTKDLPPGTIHAILLKAGLK